MASVGDWIFLIIVLSVAAGIVYAVKGSAINESLEKQREALKEKGLHISADGVSVKTNRVKVSREEEVNRAQASWAKSGEVLSKHKSAFKYGPGSEDGPSQSDTTESKTK
ncbi:hypothetical protein CBS101457_001896 [Exobasidium rhododendri]|nr:hypothetical protein CBS101457_001896 [Exobasidium rhododendri]